MKIHPSIALFYLFLAGVSLPVFAQADDGSSGTVSVCLRADIAQPPQAMQVVASGTVFTAQTKAGGRKGGEENEALVTTETVTLTHMQPCMDADASSVISHTRHWLVSPVQPQSGVVFHAVGEVSGNGLDTAFDDEGTSFRDIVRAGGITATVHNPLTDAVSLMEGAADLPPNADGEDPAIDDK
ncbi:hypothetical protein [Acetobacter pasteurianus]|uniref:Uncharacterized protein n=3 Tax=Acetobacter pasteurianus TaxID=438 RepID=C7JFN6_ACEP3|nr:hypothetical protein [Acetobacter pasteurianus]ASC04595.1 hypothetical protein S101468_00324 [Acetobacter pasteurianus subsp. pasteurianus]BAH99057.1 hypothetical protein APA01_09100 [Acetobacter pasteurianus IFO 3283-01]BAI02108.1 hypothetical protein APA03_09100 [Acetobacter pasteurianus IFO 3283-03]BAI05156.1 hypothetical protein APA07_09100 [Acetobacter pasteurianus IFO 3283-07]BAI08203.1 hypothetical protein APA22_09100 [Acetobacter pasteurianus IFO 3283-22]